MINLYLLQVLFHYETSSTDTDNSAGDELDTAVSYLEDAGAANLSVILSMDESLVAIAMIVPVTDDTLPEVALAAGMAEIRTALAGTSKRFQPAHLRLCSLSFDEASMPEQGDAS